MIHKGSPRKGKGPITELEEDHHGVSRWSKPERLLDHKSTYISNEDKRSFGNPMGIRLPNNNSLAILGKRVDPHLVPTKYQVARNKGRAWPFDSFEEEAMFEHLVWKKTSKPHCKEKNVQFAERIKLETQAMEFPLAHISHSVRDYDTK